MVGGGAALCFSLPGCYLSSEMPITIRLASGGMLFRRGRTFVDLVAREGHFIRLSADAHGSVAWGYLSPL